MASVTHTDVTNGIDGVPRNTAEETLWLDQGPDYAEFFEQCLLPNRPCILPPTLISDWDVIKSAAWQRSDGSVNWQHLIDQYGDHISPVVVTSRQNQDTRIDMTVREAITLILKAKQIQDQTSEGRSQEQSTGPSVVYIKDWHLVRQLRQKRGTTTNGQAEPYTVPHTFADDWMNNLGDSDGGQADDDDSTDVPDDFRFVYAGMAGTKTLLHRDVYTSYSWSTNVVGRKIWHLFPPRVIRHLRRFPQVETSELVPDIDTLQQILKARKNGDRSYPELELAWSHVQRVVQPPHTTIFVPSNWYHQVENLTDCISINRNWCNSVNIPNLYSAIKTEVRHVEDSLEDVRQMLREAADSRRLDEISNSSDWQREFAALVQDLAIKDAGWAWLGFWNMIERNLRSPPTQPHLRPSEKWVRDRLLPLVLDFQAQSGTTHLATDIVEAATRCQVLLEQLGT
ncbi:Clavaminate synthase-like protein [Testicularia cyperi]|uniref:Clavaminate synthase-like protein n=1 Tax=Testicularia cyperi TaxID=1882483 RepID=A0A317XZ95_9BASI|nr:Clavaminate synthase-like protein [Testicularia cyperi]